MGLRAQNNPKSSFEDPYVGTGKKAWKEYAAPNGIKASGGVINDYESGGNYYRTHMFQVSGAFAVETLSTDATLGDNIDILLIGGGGGGSGDNGGGGGAGGFLFYSDEPEPFGDPSGGSYAVTAQNYPVTIGGGGAGQMGPNVTPGSPGANSVFSTPTGAVYTAGYGGGGGCRTAAPPDAYRQPGGPAGGSGGGGGLNGPNPNSSYGHATLPNNQTSTPPLARGWRGGPGGPGPKGDSGGGGGGGANAQPAGAGGSGGSTNPTGGMGWWGWGGDGCTCKILGPMLPDANSKWAGGAGGSLYPGNTPGTMNGGNGGAGGGGAGGGYNAGKNFTQSAGFNKGGVNKPWNGNGPSDQQDKGDRSQTLGAGRWTGGGGGATGGGRGGERGNIGGNGGEGTCIVRYQISNLQYYNVKATGGYTSQYNNKTIHVFNESGTFTNVSGAPLNCEVITIAGGGGGGFEEAGGGGAGGMVLTPTITVGPAGPGAITVTVGAGGWGQRFGPYNQLTQTQKTNKNGGDSGFGPTITATGGGGGGNKGASDNTSPTDSNRDGNPGGSGGGGGQESGGSGGTGTAGQGYAGGNGVDPHNAGGGGGGAGGAGNNSPTPQIGGPGGIGAKLPSTFDDPSLGWGAPGPSPGRWFCGGGAGGCYGTFGAYYSAGGGGTNGPTGATPYAGGGNGGAYNNDVPISGRDGMINTGGGGGGGGTSPTNGAGGNGGPGIVFVAYDNPAPA